MVAEWSRKKRFYAGNIKVDYTLVKVSNSKADLRKKANILRRLGERSGKKVRIRIAVANKERPTPSGMRFVKGKYALYQYSK